MNPGWNDSLNGLTGVGNTRTLQLEKLKIRSVGDLLMMRPKRHEDRRHVASIGSAQKGDSVLLLGALVAHGVNRFQKGRKSVYEFVLDDGSARLHARFWNLPYLESQFAIGVRVFVFGKITGERPLTMDHPEFEIIEEGDEAPLHLNRIVPVYRLSEGISQRWLRGLMHRTLQHAWEETNGDQRIASNHFRTPISESLRQLHFPLDLEQIDLARRRFALEEFLNLQRGFHQRRVAFHKKAAGRACGGNNRLIKPFLKRLEFELTAAQTRVLREIRGDMSRTIPMRRLLHGDVGSGKTVVAACAALMAIESGCGVALMAPTELLAQQHHRKLRQWLEPIGVPVELLTGRNRTASVAVRNPVVTIGTHALIHDGYQPENLGLVIIDEQHRFGVIQKEKLVRKGSQPHLLVMTATPIPRTLGLTAYGDLEISVLDQVPARRGIVRTHLRTTADLSKVWQFVKKELAGGRQAYVVYPRIDEATNDAGLKSVQEEFDRLSELFTPYSVGLVHGRMTSDAADRVMEAFRAGAIQLLVATTVIEVGLDVPNATVMVIENAGQYGLSQLHQLRGRIGRGSQASHCILIEDARKAEAVARLKVMLETNDGFVLAEQDMKLRGVGDFLGTRQSGIPKFKFGDLVVDRDLVELARQLVERGGSR